MVDYPTESSVNSNYSSYTKCDIFTTLISGVRIPMICNSWYGKLILLTPFRKKIKAACKYSFVCNTEKHIHGFAPGCINSS